MEQLKITRDAQWIAMWAELKADGIEPFPLWPDKELPRLALLPIHKEKRGILIVCAGGGFRLKSFNEAKPVAEFFHARGMNAAILDYRLHPHTPQESGEDGSRAIRYLRANADKLNILPDHIAIGGFSAGGMLSAMAATRFDAGDANSPDPIERVSSRPDAALLWYGAMARSVTIGEGIGYDVKRQNEIARLDSLKNLRYDCPPFFLFQTHQDDPRFAMNFGRELADRGIPFEVHTFAEGAHGGGLYNGKDDTPDVPHTARWAGLAAEWLEAQGF